VLGRLITPGLRTSEFKVALATVLAAIVSASADWVTARYAFAGGVLAAISYVLSRGHAKAGGNGGTTYWPPQVTGAISKPSALTPPGASNP
jgi:hypothetical protein